MHQGLDSLKSVKSHAVGGQVIAPVLGEGHTPTPQVKKPGVTLQGNRVIVKSLALDGI